MYFTLALSSMRTSSTRDNCKNNSAALGLSGFLSGWQESAFLRYDVLI